MGATAAACVDMKTTLAEHGGFVVLGLGTAAAAAGSGSGGGAGGHVDPLRLTIGLSSTTATTATISNTSSECTTLAAIDEWLWCNHGIVCELNGDTSLTFCVPPLSPWAPALLTAALIGAYERVCAGAGAGAGSAAVVPTATTATTNTNTNTSSCREEEMCAFGALLLGRVSADTLLLYPGTPLVVRGGVITTDVLEALTHARAWVVGRGGGVRVVGASDPSLSSLLVFS